VDKSIYSAYYKTPSRTDPIASSWRILFLAVRRHGIPVQQLQVACQCGGEGSF
jgi:hypothetical protein